MPLLSEDGFVEDVREAERVITEVTGTDPRPWARFPFGAGADHADLVARLAALGYRHVGWDVEVYEWDPGRSADEIAARAVDGVLAHGDGAIVLLHTWPDPVAPASGRDRRAAARRWRAVRRRRRARPPDGPVAGRQSAAAIAAPMG